MKTCRILNLQPFYGGSHRAFIDGWASRSTHDWTSLTLPDRFWKWRMRHASIWMAEATMSLLQQGATFDLIFCTDMMNLAEYRGLLSSAGFELPPAVLYFHENQFEYPTRFTVNSFEQQRDEHFAFTNFVSALAASEVWFNSDFNRQSMLNRLGDRSGHWPDFRPTIQVERLGQASRVEFPGIETPEVDVSAWRQRRVERARDHQPIHLCWAARWEHDKGPDLLLAALDACERLSLPFQLSVLGPSFRNVPKAFDEIQRRYTDQIVDWGFADTRAEYWAQLAKADVFLSTASHEFFGLSAAEAICAGLRPLLPNRLAYPELLSLMTKANARTTGNGAVAEGSSCTQYTYQANGEFQGKDQAAEQVDWLAKTSIQIALQLQRLIQHREQSPEQWLPEEAERDRFWKVVGWPTRSTGMDRRLVELDASLANK